MTIAEDDACVRGVRSVIVIGGAEIFQLFHDEVDTVYLTEVDVDIDDAGYSDVAKFERNFRDWHIGDELAVPAGEGGDQYAFKVTVYYKPNVARCVQAPALEAA